MTHIKLYLSGILFGLLAMGTVAVVARYQRDIQVAREALNSLGSQVMDTACGPIEYARVGKGDPVLVVNGTMGGFDQGLEVAKPVIDAGYQVISISRFGYLRSPLPAGADVNQQTDAFVCLLDALGIQKVAVLTVSGGATSSIRFAARYPERVSALILVSPAAPGDVKVSPPPKAVFDTLRSDFVWWVMVTYFRPVAQTIIGVPKGFKLTPELETEVTDDLLKSLPISNRIDGSIFDNYNVDTEFYDEISEANPYSVYHIQIPTLIINALDDPYAVPENVRGLAVKFPNARLIVLPDGGHELLGHSTEVGAEITQFLRNNLAAADNSQ